MFVRKKNVCVSNRKKKYSVSLKKMLRKWLKKCVNWLKRMSVVGKKKKSVVRKKKWKRCICILIVMFRKLKMKKICR